MRLVVDANILVAELLRSRGRVLLQDERLELFVAEVAWLEANYELERRGKHIIERQQLSQKALHALLEPAKDIAQAVVSVVPEPVYIPLHRDARLRIPRDPDDWHTVALALLLDAAIWTQDHDFLGCGVATL